MAGFSEGGCDRRHSHAHGLKAAGSRHSADILASGRDGSIPGRTSLEAGIDRRDYPRFAGSCRLVQGVEVISEGPVNKFYEPGRGSAGFWVSGESVVNCGWV